MYRLFSAIILLILFVGCQTSDNIIKNKDFEYVNYGDNANGALKGTIIDPHSEEGAPFVNIRIEGTTIGVASDIDGRFELKDIPPGAYNLQISSPGSSMTSIGIEIKAGKMLWIKEDIPLEIQEEMLEKPMIYVYPEETTEVTVSLEYNGELTHTYPKSEGDWTVTAAPDGRLTDNNGRNYYGLYWEGIAEKPIVPNCGAVVSRDSIISFLESSLDQLGLNYKEANEFIVYWLPRLEQSEYNLIYFAEEDYTEQAELKISPQPETVIRVMMSFVPLKSPIEITPQVLPIQPERKGFTVVEWGGTECSAFEI